MFEELLDTYIKVISNIPKSEPVIVASLEEFQKSLQSFVCPILNQLPSVVVRLGEIFKEYYDDYTICLLQVTSGIGWCNVDCFLESDSLNPEKNISSISEKVFELQQQNNELKVSDIDSYIGKRITKSHLRKIEDETILFLNLSDASKLKRAMIDFRAKRYMDCAMLLSSLIDSQSIKQEIYDYNSGRFKERFLNPKTQEPHISQCWKSFYHVFSNNFSMHFDNEELCEKADYNDFKNYLDRIKGKIPEDKIFVAVIGLSISLLVLYDNIKWQFCDNKIPCVINRHWLMHGMYNIEDVSKYDCIKLLLILNQICQIYSKVREGYFVAW